MLTKSFDTHLKAAGDRSGQFEAVVSVFNNVDSYGDVVMPGAFADTLAEWEKSGDPIPVLWSHQSADPASYVGHVIEAKETAEGLWVKGQLDLDSPNGAQVHRMLKNRWVKQFSFAYDILDAAHAERDGEKVYELRKLKLYEVGPCLIGANQETRLIGVKADRAVSVVVDGTAFTSDEKNRIAVALEEILLDRIDGKAKAAGPAKFEEPDGAKNEEPNGAAPAHVRRLADLGLFEIG